MNPFLSLGFAVPFLWVSSLPSSQSVRAFCVQMIQNQTPRVARGAQAPQDKPSGSAGSGSLDTI